MKTLGVLEEKITKLVTLAKELKAQNDTLKSDREQLKSESKELRTENTRLAEDGALLATKLKAIEGDVFSSNERIEETKMVVDDLIDSIDSLIGNEHQQ